MYTDFLLVAEDTSIELTVDIVTGANRGDHAKLCSDKCAETEDEVNRVYIGLRSVSDTKVKCACIPRDFNKIIGMVPEDTPHRNGYQIKKPEARDNGAYIYSFFRK